MGTGRITHSAQYQFTSTHYLLLEIHFRTYKRYQINYIIREPRSRMKELILLREITHFNPDTYLLSYLRKWVTVMPLPL